MTAPTNSDPTVSINDITNENILVSFIEQMMEEHRNPYYVEELKKMPWINDPNNPVSGASKALLRSECVNNIIIKYLQDVLNSLADAEKLSHSPNLRCILSPLSISLNHIMFAYYQEETSLVSSSLRNQNGINFQSLVAFINSILKRISSSFNRLNDEQFCTPEGWQAYCNTLTFLNSIYRLTSNSRNISFWLNFIRESNLIKNTDIQSWISLVHNDINIKRNAIIRFSKVNEQQQKFQFEDIKIILKDLHASFFANETYEEIIFSVDVLNKRINDKFTALMNSGDLKSLLEINNKLESLYSVLKEYNFFESIAPSAARSNFFAPQNSRTSSLSSAIEIIDTPEHTLPELPLLEQSSP